MAHKTLVPKGSAPPLAPYSPGTQAGDIVYVAGTVARGEDGETVNPDDAAGQTRHILEQIKAVLAEAGGTMADITFNQIFLKSYDDYAAMNAVYGEYFPNPAPARYCIKADLVKPDYLVEIASTAHVGN
jgi:aminoacrylate peracid reductase